MWQFVRRLFARPSAAAAACVCRCAPGVPLLCCCHQMRSIGFDQSTSPWRVSTVCTPRCRPPQTAVRFGLPHALAPAPPFPSSSYRSPARVAVAAVTRRSAMCCVGCVSAFALSVSRPSRQPRAVPSCGSDSFRCRSSSSASSTSRSGYNALCSRSAIACPLPLLPPPSRSDPDRRHCTRRCRPALHSTTATVRSSAAHAVAHPRYRHNALQCSTCAAASACRSRY